MIRGCARDAETEHGTAGSNNVLILLYFPVTHETVKIQSSFCRLFIYLFKFLYAKDCIQMTDLIPEGYSLPVN